MAESRFVAKIDPKLAEEIRRDLEESGFTLSKPQHTCFSAKKPGLIVTLYESGSFVVQGKGTKEFVEFYVEPKITLKQPLELTARIGSDEAGKGDFFGPLCIATVFAEGELIYQLQSLGVKDSKMIGDRDILKIGAEIIKLCPHQIVRLNPSKYNELYDQFGNLNTLLAWAHATAIQFVVEETGCRYVIIDQFAYEGVMERAIRNKNISINLVQRTKAEEDIVVAAASILARRAFLQGLEQLGTQFGMVFPKGASLQVIAAGKEFVKRYGEAALSQVSKLHFKTKESVV